MSFPLDHCWVLLAKQPSVHLSSRRLTAAHLPPSRAVGIAVRVEITIPGNLHVATRGRIHRQSFGRLIDAVQGEDDTFAWLPAPTLERFDGLRPVVENEEVLDAAPHHLNGVGSFLPAQDRCFRVLDVGCFLVSHKMKLVDAHLYYLLPPMSLDADWLPTFVFNTLNRVTVVFAP
jgi:hypothetical protein